MSCIDRGEGGDNGESDRGADEGYMGHKAADVSVLKQDANCEVSSDDENRHSLNHSNASLSLHCQ